MPRNAASDEDLIQAIAEGEDAALSELMLRHRRWVLNLVQAFVHEREQAEDITQEVFVRVYRHAADYISEGRFLAWLKRIAINLAKDALRQQRRTPLILLSEQEAEALQEPPFEPTVALMSEALAADVRQAIQSLPEEQRLVLVMRYFGDMSVPDIAWAMQRPEGTIKSRLFYGLRYVRQKLAEMWETEVRLPENPSRRSKVTVTNFYSVNGEILGEKTTGGSRIDYLTDALGSVTGTLNQSAQVVNTYRYKPYGAQLAKTGVGPDPAFGWVGTQGYRKNGRKFSDFYVRTRHYSSDEARWNTKDPIGYAGGSFNLYSYTTNQPVTASDPSGLQSPSQRNPFTGPKDCRKLSPGACYACLFNYYWIGLGLDPRNACIAASRICHTNFPCNSRGPIPPHPSMPPSSPPLPIRPAAPKPGMPGNSLCSEPMFEKVCLECLPLTQANDGLGYRSFHQCCSELLALDVHDLALFLSGFIGFAPNPVPSAPTVSCYCECEKNSGSYPTGEDAVAAYLRCVFNNITLAVAQEILKKMGYVDIPVPVDPGRIPKITLPPKIL